MWSELISIHHYFFLVFLTVNFCLSVTGHKLPAKCECYFANDFILNRGKNPWIDFKSFGFLGVLEQRFDYSSINKCTYK